MSSPRRLLCAVALAGTALVLGAVPASAHANLVTSEPANGATLATAPTTLRLTFSEQPDPSLSSVDLLTVSGAKLDVGSPTLSGSATLEVPITGALPEGVYTVSWSVVSVEDGHTTAGAFAFGVGVTPTAGPSTPPSGTTTSGPTALNVVSKTALYGGLMLLVAIAVVGEWLFGGAPKARPRVGSWAAAAVLLGALGFVWAQQRATGASLGRYLDSSAARTPIWLIVVTLIAAILALAATRSSRRWLPWAAGAAAAIALALRAHGGHAAAAPTPLLDQFAQWIHVLAGACWAGGLVLLVLLVRERRGDPPVKLVRRFSTLVLVAIAVIVVSGLRRATTELGGLDDVVRIWQTSYGRVLAIKVAVVLTAIALGAVNRYRSIGRLPSDRHPLLRIAGAEIVAVAGVLALTATLTGFPPPVSAVGAQPQPTDTVIMTGSDFATTLVATVTVTPAQPGPNLYRATLTRYGTDDVLSADAVMLHLASVTRPELSGATIDLRSDGTDWIGQALDPSIAGTFRVTADVRTGADVVEVPLTLVTRSTGQITTTEAPDNETVALATFDDGVRLQGTSAQGTPTQVHLTAFAPDGKELPIERLDLVASPATGPPTRLGVTRFTAGHFAASAILDPGAWTFDAVATTRDGRAFQCTWSSTVTG